MVAYELQELISLEIIQPEHYKQLKQELSNAAIIIIDEELNI